MERGQEIGVAAGSVADAISQEVVGLAAAAINRVVPSERVFHNGHERQSSIGIKDRALTDVHRALHLDGVHRTVAVLKIIGRIAKEVDGLLAFQINDA